MPTTLSYTSGAFQSADSLLGALASALTRLLAHSHFLLSDLLTLPTFFSDFHFPVFSIGLFILTDTPSVQSFCSGQQNSLFETSPTVSHAISPLFFSAITF